MTFKHSFKTALTGLRTNKSRSALTILGIVIGITAIILIMSLGQGAQDLILGQIQGIGSKIIGIVPGRQPKGPSDIFSTFTDSLKEKDLEALEKKGNAPNIVKIMPIVFGSNSVSYGSEVYRPTLFGVSSNFADIYNIHPKESGRNFTEDEIKGYSDVAIIGDKVREKLFANQNPISEKIKIKNRSYKIIGVLEKKGQMSFLNFDDSVIVPYTNAQKYIFGIKYFHRIAAEADSEKNVAQAVSDIKATIRSSHNITDPEKDDFFVETQAEAMETIKTVTDVLTLFLIAVAAISLIVGGIGIMNIMLVSVTERTKEIGLRKSLGATEKNIMTQFLLEAVVLTGLGGLIGTILGASFSFISSLILSQLVSASWKFSFPIEGMLIGLAVSAFVGLVFGIYPARQAAKKSPMEALRYE
ncbi:multidrug ABC transporter substrate-binding protein [Candidatus Wolfebacteria bacterium CG10_big_fil_rev_8_21_14_0_10_31_9]|uniref:Multidrug ABC transporter substrate-binding protein n=1 Tax=Candidatus Wolfebacteria bacterium CG10_big_fil_rev_8_21_14_0_10_31_9 TaxID=1975070 RepID=A0A2H0RC65_9BACT|nr:MAG: multidrug ABC transporter substrate-binding protein [Candidatus Wolfebacteria bacterium CG10_big_fil_rev_8_21_14_0_10_31_9]